MTEPSGPGDTDRHPSATPPDTTGIATARPREFVEQKSAAAGGRPFLGKEAFLVLLGGILAVIGGFVSQMYQSRTKRDLKYVELRIEEQRQAVDALAKIGQTGDAPFAAALLLCSAMLENRADTVVTRLTADYAAARAEWVRQQGTNKVLGRVHFGNGALDGLALADSMLERIESDFPKSLQAWRYVHRFQGSTALDRRARDASRDLVKASLNVVTVARERFTILRQNVGRSCSISTNSVV
jgi:hypothetical protein